jgi:maltooligosyltrehalose trehalohydrolase
MHRGALAIVCNLGADPVEVPVAGDVVLAWSEPTPGGTGATRIDGHSVAVLRTVK